MPSSAFKAIKYLGWQLYNKTGSRSRYTTNNLQCLTSSHESHIKRQFHFLWQMYLTSLRQTALNSIKVRPNLYLNSSTNLAIVNKLSQLYFFCPFLTNLHKHWEDNYWKCLFGFDCWFFIACFLAVFVRLFCFYSCFVFGYFSVYIKKEGEAKNQLSHWFF